MRGGTPKNHRWLLQLRWGSCSFQFIAILVTHFVLGIALPLAPMLMLAGVTAASNLTVMWWYRRHAPTPQTLAALMAVDVLIITGLLYLSGGAYNPFSLLYLVYVTLCAVVLPVVWAWVLFGLSLSCYGALFWSYRSLPLGHHMPGSADSHLNLHLEGMWVAFVITAGMIVYFVHHIASTVRRQELELGRIREITERNDRLASLATLAAGAAHELSSPLATIAIVAKELERQIASSETDESVSDARLIRTEVERCRKILERMAADLGSDLGETPETIAVSQLIEDVVSMQPDPMAASIAISQPAEEVLIEIPKGAVAQVLRALLANAHQASIGKLSPISIEASVQPSGELHICIVDSGPGMSPEVLAHAVEPFFTTKAPGQGMGLGLFLAHEVLERLGGRLELSSVAGEGVSATVVIPPSRVVSPDGETPTRRSDGVAA